MRLQFVHSILVSVSALVLSGCVSMGDDQATPGKPVVPPHIIAMYAAIDTEPFSIPAPDLTKIDPRFYRQHVAYQSNEPTGTIIVDTPARFLYLQQENGMAMRYGIGVGSAGLEFSGAAVVQYKRHWPRWRPTKDMIARQPERYGPLANGMEPGPTNPLGARALYLFKNGEDTLFRIHGTNEDWSIGKAISSGCIRLLTHDIIDLYQRIPNGTRVIVLQGEQTVVEVTKLGQ